MNLIYGLLNFTSAIIAYQGVFSTQFKNVVVEDTHLLRTKGPRILSDLRKNVSREPEPKIDSWAQVFHRISDQVVEASTSKLVDMVNSADDEKKIEYIELLTAGIIDQILYSDVPANELASRIGKASEAADWLQILAKKVLDFLVKEIDTGKGFRPELQMALKNAVIVTTGFSRDHSEYNTLVAIGLLKSQAPLIIEFLGSSYSVPVAGSWAAEWQAQFSEFVSVRALITYLQRLGTHW